MQLEKVLIAGPWVGEFGWELFCWHAYVRALSKYFDKTIIISSKHSQFLYIDFCDKFIGFDPEQGSYKDSYYKVGFKENSQLLNELLKEEEYSRENQKITLFKPRRIGDPPRTHYSQSFDFGPYSIKPEYIKFGKKSKESNNIIIHARNRSLRPQDNWSEKKWKKLVDKLIKTGYNIVSIGLIKEAMHIEGSQDMRECNQDELLDLLASAKCIFGPSSGAMHLASLCGCPQIVWTTNYNFDRYTKNWNPHRARVLFLSEYGWQPEPEYVYKGFKEFINADN